MLLGWLLWLKRHMSTNFKKGSAFKDDKFKYENEDFTPEELKDLERKDFNPKLLEDIQEKKDEDFVEVMEDDERATAYVEGVEKAKISKAKDLRDEAANYVDLGRKGSFASYRINLAEWGMWTLMQKGFPKGYEYHCIPTKEGSLDIYGKNFKTRDGIIFVLKDKEGKVYIRAMGISLNTEIDVSNIQLMAVEVENTIDAIEGRLEAVDSQKT